MQAQLNSLNTLTTFTHSATNKGVTWKRLMILSGVIKMSSEPNLQDVVLKLIEQNNKLIEQNSLIVQINAEQSAQLSEVLLMLEDSEPAQRSGSLDG